MSKTSEITASMNPSDQSGGAREQVRIALEALVAAGDVHELRGLRLAGGANALAIFDRDSIPRVVEQAVAWEEAGAAGVYVSLNPLDPALLGAGRAARDTDVVCRRLVLIDLDPVRRGPDGVSLENQVVPSTDAERAAAKAILDELSAMLRHEGVEGVIAIDSGNGFHLLVPVNLPGDDASKELIQRLLKWLNEAYGNKDVVVDPKTFNASRITKLPGTLTRKGKEIPDRPYRRAALLSAQGVSEEARNRNTVVLRNLVARSDFALQAAAANAYASGQPGAVTNKVARATAYSMTMPPALAGRPACPESGNTNHGHDQTWHVVATVVQGFDLNEDEALAALAPWNVKCDPPWSRDELLHKIRDAVDREPKDRPKGYLLAGRPDDRPNDVPADVGPDDVAGIADLIAAGAKVDWLWEGWIQRGVLTVLASEPGGGKTRLVCDLIRRIRHGLEWPDGTPMTVPTTSLALYVAADNNHDEIVTIAQAFDIASAIKLNARKADPYAGVLLETEEDLHNLERHVKAVQPVLVVIDTTGNATDKNVCRSEEAKRFFQPLQVLARKYRVAVLCLTHLNATGGVLGRRALEKARVALRLERPDQEGEPKRRRLEVLKSNSKCPDPLGVTMRDGGNEYDDDPRRPVPRDGCQRGAGGR